MQTSTFWLKFRSLSPPSDLKISSRSPKPNQLFMVSKSYIHAKLVKICQLVHIILYRQETVTLTLTADAKGSAPKTIYPPPLRWGHIKMSPLNGITNARHPKMFKPLNFLHLPSLRKLPHCLTNLEYFHFVLPKVSVCLINVL